MRLHYKHVHIQHKQHHVLTKACNSSQPSLKPPIFLPNLSSIWSPNSSTTNTWIPDSKSRANDLWQFLKSISPKTLLNLQFHAYTVQMISGKAAPSSSSSRPMLHALRCSHAVNRREWIEKRGSEAPSSRRSGASGTSRNPLPNVPDEGRSPSDNWLMSLLLHRPNDDKLHGDRLVFGSASSKTEKKRGKGRMAQSPFK